MLSAILFDLDGTLANTDTIHFAIWQDILHPYGIGVDRSLYDATFSGRLNVDIIADILPQLSDAEGKQLSDRKEQQFRERAANELVPLAGLETLLQWTVEQGIDRGVVTNAPAANANFMIDALKLRPWFSTIVISEQLPQGKPHPLPYLTGLTKLGVAADQALVFEDSPSGIRSAVAAGIFTIGVTSTHQPTALLQVGAKHTIADFEDAALLPILERLTQ
ncbi:MAG: HAD-IA family hydrolase [Cyanobacteria bacterium P01_A01_bin.135]